MAVLSARGAIAGPSAATGGADWPGPDSAVRSRLEDGAPPSPATASASLDGRQTTLPAMYHATTSSQHRRTCGHTCRTKRQCDLPWTLNSMSRTARLQHNGKRQHAPVIRTAPCSAAAAAPSSSLLKRSGRQRTPRTRQGVPEPGAPRPQSRPQSCLNLRRLQMAVRSRLGCQVRPLSTSPAQVAAVTGRFAANPSE